MAKGGPSRVYEDFDPPSELVSEEGLDIFRVYLPGFKKDQLRVQLTTSRLLKISGECPIGDNKWKRFLKEFRVPPNCDTKEITAKLEGGILYIRLPKPVTPTMAHDQLRDKARPTTELPKPQPPQPQAPLPQPQPQLHSQPYVPRDVSEKEATLLKAKEEDANTRRGKESTPSKDEERKDESGLTKASDEVVSGRSRVLTELRKPKNLMKRVVVPVFVVAALVLYIFYMFKSFTRNEYQEGSLLEFDQEL